MSLWGIADSKTSSGTVTITSATGAVVGVTTAFTTQAKVGNYIRISGEDYVILAIADDTHCTVGPGVQGATMTARSGVSYALSERPAFVSKAESSDSAWVSGNSTKVYGADATEESVASNQAKGIAHAGWVRYHTYTDSSSSTRHKSEVLVAGGSITGDAADDSVLADS